MIVVGWSPLARVLEAAACGVPVISNAWDGSDALPLPNFDTMLAGGSEDVIDILKSVSIDPSAIGKAASPWILRNKAADRAAGPKAMNRESERMRNVATIALVTGGAGFIGSNLCRRLIDDGAEVICLDSMLTGRPENLRDLEDCDRFHFVQHDVIDQFPQWLRAGRTRFTHIYHLACAASPPHYQANPEHTMLTNVVGTHHALRLAEETGARLLLTSTSEVYGDPDVHPQTEEYRGNVNCTGPRACYDEGKRAAETLVFDYIRAARCEARVARIFNTYGPHMRSDDGRVISNVVCQALNGDDITVYGDGSQTRSFCYVDDLVEGLRRLMDSDRAAGMPVNIGNPNELTVGELVDLVLEMTGSPSGLVRLPLPEDDPRRRKPNIDRARTLLGWQPRVSLRDGLEQTIAWFAGEGRPAERIDIAELAAAE